MADVYEPEAASLARDKTDALLERVQREVDTGHLPSCQVALVRNGVVGVAKTFGAPIDSRYTIFSATKPFVAMAFWTLLDEGLFRLDDPVSDHIPEFALNGKRDITIEQVMLHTSGFPHAPLGPPQWDKRESRLEAFGRWRTNWEPGTRFEYHPTSAHWVLAELIERGSGGDYRDYIARTICAPLGLTRFQLGVKPQDQGDIRQLVATGEVMTPDEIEAVFGFRTLPVSEVTTEALLQHNRADVREVGVPGGGGVSNALDVAMFYQALLEGGRGLISHEAMQDFSVNVRNTFPDFLGTPANRALGLVIASDDGKNGLRGMGKTVAPGTFGHNGAGGQIAFADPTTGVSFVYLTDGLDEHVVRSARRTTAIASYAGACAV